MRPFKINDQSYELVTFAEDRSSKNLGKIAIYRIPNTQKYFTMPWKELRVFFQKPQTIDWDLRIKLYKSRFINRQDVYAKRYFNRKMQKKAYSPDGPFENGKPSLTTHWKLTDHVLFRHLSSQEDFALGIYPLAPDNTTKFLAFDIDGHHEKQPWKEVATALVKVCYQSKLEPLLEVSQSGKGCHVWLFFEKPVPARLVRKLGDLLLKMVQAINPEMPMSAFDRLFPAQDQIAPDKLGNLIAAPLEGKAAQMSHGIFVDNQWKPLQNQWKALQNVATISLQNVQRLIEEKTAKELYQLYDESSSVTDNIEMKPILKKTLTVVRANALYLLKAELTANEILRLKWLSSFKNPKFYELQARRMPVYQVPRIISLFKETDKYLVLPRGLEQQLIKTTKKINWIDKTQCGIALHVNFNGKLRKNQVQAFDAIKDYNTGILAARTGFGKTVIGARLIVYHAVSTLILVPNKVLAEQWRKSLKNFLLINDSPVIEERTPSGRKKHKESIGTFYGQKKNLSGLVDIATIQSLSKMTNLKQFLSRYGMVISDEVHHNAAFTFDNIISQIASKYLYGLSATPYRRDGQDPILTMRFGEIRYQTEVIDPAFVLKISRKVFPRYTSFGMGDIELLQNGMAEIRNALMGDNQRNQMIVRDINECLRKKRHIIVLTSLVDHVDELYFRLSKEHVYRIYGRVSAKERELEIEKIKADSEPYVILATFQTGGEGLDISNLDTMILAMPVSFQGNVSQYIGRLHRNLEKKKELLVFDYVDMFIPILMRMFNKRKRAYKLMQYDVFQDEYTKQDGLQIYNGHYQTEVINAAQVSQSLTIVVPKIGSFLRKLVEKLRANGCRIEILSQSEPDWINNKNIRWTHVENNLPSCIIIDDQQLWLSADINFNFNQGMAIQFKHPELVKQFKKMLEQTGF